MKLIVGLGNPGAKYSRNRHNVGFHAVDEIQTRHGFIPWRERFQGWISTGTINDEKVTLLKPQTYMNESGRSVGEAVRYFKIPLEDIVVFYDELDLVPGKVRVKTGGGSGGHNGIRSMDAHIGKDYQRVRIGIGHPGHKDRVSQYVLSDFAKADGDWLEPLLGDIARAVPTLLNEGAPGFMNKLALLQNTTDTTTARTKPGKRASEKTVADRVPQTETPIGPMAAALKALLPKTKKD
ncbi:MAG: aminoacyl-tRNA hydrolase [Hyphomicrobiales bacterium]